MLFNHPFGIIETLDGLMDSTSSEGTLVTVLGCIMSVLLQYPSRKLMIRICQMDGRQQLACSVRRGWTYDFQRQAECTASGVILTTRVWISWIHAFLP